MSSERQCGLGSLLPMSCRGRAEAFARRLHTRLRSLGTDAQGLSHQRHPDSDAYYDFDVEGEYEEPSSPAEAVAESDLDNLPVNGQIHKDPESGCILSSPIDNDSPPSNSDSDITYYDLDSEHDPSGSKSKSANHHLKYQRLYDEHNQMNRSILNMNKLKLSLPTHDNREQFIPFKNTSPEKHSPIKTQPLARENGYADYGSLEKRDSFSSLYSPIKFDDCQKRSSIERRSSDETEISPKPSFSNAGNSTMFSYSPDIEEVDEPDFSKPLLSNGVHEDITKDHTILEEKEEIKVDDETKDCKETEVEVNDKEIHQIDNKEEEEEEEESIAENDSKQEEVIHENESNGLSVSEEKQHTEENDTEVDDRPQRVRRCSSLRSGKTPPGTPGRKKIVRFADVLGLDLADVKTFMDDIPNIPKSAFEDLRDADLSLSSNDSYQQAPPVVSDKRLVCLFSQPGDKPNFLDILNTKSVCLENAVVQDSGSLAVCGTVRVRNLDFHKSVQIRYTLDDWKTFSDLQASYVPNSCDGFSDRFQFLLYAHTLVPGQKLQFALRFMCKGCQFWDNNGGENYCFQCLPYSTSDVFYQQTCISPVDSWRASFY